MQLAHGHIEHGIVGIFQMQKLLQSGAAIGVFLAHVHIDQAVVAAYAVGAVHHGVAHFQLAQIAD